LPGDVDTGFKERRERGTANKKREEGIRSTEDAAMM
jgi:hypothetical protein